MTKAIKAIEEKIGSYLSSLDQADAADTDPDTPTPSTAEVREKIKTLTERKARYQDLHEGLKNEWRETSLPDRSGRPVDGDASWLDRVDYNVQTAVDEKHQLIVEHEVTNDPTDHAHLAEMASRAKETLGVEQLEVVADMGYYDGAEVKQCAAAGVTAYIPKPFTAVNQKRGLFTKQDFVDDEAEDKGLTVWHIAEKESQWFSSSDSPLL